MDEDLAERIYQTVVVGLLPEYRVPGVEFAFEEGSFCMTRYGEMLNAYERLCDRLGVVDEDEDVEVIISALLDIQSELCHQMYRYGAQFGNS